MARAAKTRDLSLAQALGQFLERTLVPDLRARVEESPAVKRALDDALARERAAGRTADDAIAWRERTLEQVGAAWLLDCVFVRYLEDRGFLSHRRLAGEGALDAQERFGAAFPGLAGNAREYLLATFREVGNLHGARDLLGAERDVARRLGPSANVAGDLLRLLRETLADGTLRWRFDVDDTRVLGDLYQDLSASVRERYALLQTPDFVESFILERTLVPAVKEFGLREFRVIDPTCGSGHFVLGAFHRLRELHAREAPASDPKDHANAALAHVFGVDLNPFAVAITRFRLLVAYLRAAGIARLRDVPSGLDLHRHVVVADSLLYGSKTPSLVDAHKSNTVRREFFGDLFTLEDPIAASEVFGAKGFHAVVGNPPYIVCRDAALRELYRARYPNSASGKFALAAPFTERFFDLAAGGGYVGLINSNSFMKREFGRGLVEKVLPHVDLTAVVDTSGAYIPGHGTPTVILFGRNQKARGDALPVVMGRRGEPATPDEPAEGKVWSSIAAHDTEVGFENDFVTVAEVPRKTLAKHPWSLGGGGASDLKALIEKQCEKRLRDVGVVGVGGMSNADDVYIAPRGEHIRLKISPAFVRELALGEEIRDWFNPSKHEVFFPYSDALDLLQPEGSELHAMWPYRTTLWARVVFGGGSYKSIKRPWWEWHQVTKDRYKTPLSITYAEVATHNHFVLDRGGKVFKQTAPIIKLPASATEDDHFALLAWLNSSVACFWMKQVCMNKGIRGEGGGFTSETWEQFHQFASTKLLEFPIPAADFATRAGLALNENGSHLAHYTLAAQLAHFDLAKHGSLDDLLAWAANVSEGTRETMVREQEELDWRWYEHLGLLTHEERTTHTKARERALVDDLIPSYPAGLRAFERAMYLSGQETAWFERNGYVVPTDAAMATLSRAMRRLIALRVEIMGANRNIGLLERPEYKRRWTRRNVLEEARDACTTALLDAIERIAKGDLPPQSIRTLASAVLRDARIHAIATMRFPGEDDLPARLAELIEAESVPFLTKWRFTEAGVEKRAAWERTWDLQRREDAGEAVGDIPVPPKYDQKDYREARYWSLRGKLDVPRERFISYPGLTSQYHDTPLYGWAGWDHRQRADALTAIYHLRRDEDGWTGAQLVPLLAGLDELIPWLKQWHNAPSPGEDMGAGDAYDAFVTTQLHELGLTRADLTAWRPPEKRTARATAAKVRVAAPTLPFDTDEAPPAPKKRGRPKKTA